MPLANDLLTTVRGAAYRIVYAAMAKASLRSH